MRLHKKLPAGKYFRLLCSSSSNSLLSILGIRKDIRFFDDDPGIHNKYFDGFPVAVESLNDLIEEPVSHMLILSSSFGRKIKERVQQLIPSTAIEIACLEDFIHESSYMSSLLELIYI